MIAWLSFISAAAVLARDATPELSLRLRLNDPVATLALAGGRLDRGLAEGTLTPQQRAALAAASRDALRAQVLDPRGFQVLGVLADLDGRREAARRFMATALMLSRRNLATHLWLIEDRVAGDDIAGALRHYDMALRTSNGASTLLFPVLNGGLSEPSIRGGLVPYVRANPSWVRHFAGYALGEGDVANLTRLLIEARCPDVLLDGGQLTSQLFARLVEQRQFGLARRFYLMLPQTADSILRTASFTYAAVDPRYAPLTWAIYPTADFTVEFMGEGGGGPLRVTTASTAAETVAMKALYLAPGRYTLAARGRWNSGDAAAARIRLTCASEPAAPVLGEAILPARSETAAIRVDVPAACREQLLRIVADTGGDSGIDVELDRIVVSPVR